MGAGFYGLLSIVLLVLKLTMYQSWSWWIVASPLIAQVVLVIIFTVISILLAAWVSKHDKD